MYLRDFNYLWYLYPTYLHVRYKEYLIVVMHCTALRFQNISAFGCTCTNMMCWLVHVCKYVFIGQQNLLIFRVHVCLVKLCFIVIFMCMHTYIFPFLLSSSLVCQIRTNVILLMSTFILTHTRRVKRYAYCVCLV